MRYQAYIDISNNNHSITIPILKTNKTIKTVTMRIFLIAAIFYMMVSNTNGNVFAQGGNNGIVGCANTVKVIFSHLPGQTSDASTQVTLSNIGPNDDHGTGSISIPGIGSGNVKVYFHIATVREYGATVSDLPGQTQVSPAARLSQGSV